MTGRERLPPHTGRVVVELQPMASLYPAVLTGAEWEPKLADGGPRDRQLFPELGGQARRAASTSVSRTAREEQEVVADMDPGWRAPAGLLAVLSTGSSA